MAKLPSLLPQLLLLSGPAGLLLWCWLKRNRPDASAVSTKGLPGASVYSATKAAVRSFARTWTIELAQRGIRVNALSPGPVDTPIYTKLGVTPEQVQGSVSKFRKPHRPVASASQKKWPRSPYFWHLQIPVSCTGQTLQPMAGLHRFNLRAA